MKKIMQKIINFDLKALLQQLIIKANSPFFVSFLISFICLNIIFIYHGSHFIIGDHDWKYLQKGIKITEGNFEGRFSQFILINLLSLGKILPIINNLLGFLGFSFGISLLAVYWKLPKTKTAYTLFSLFSTITPFILAFMYFAFITIPCLSWNALIIASLIISSNEKNFSLTKTLISSLLITISLGGYPPVINLFATALATRMFIDVYYTKTSFSQLIKEYSYTIINFGLGVIFYKLCLQYLTYIKEINTNYYNLQTIPVSQYFSKFLLITKDLFRQFHITLPFITKEYKTLTLGITILAITSLILPLKNKKLPSYIYLNDIFSFLSSNTLKTLLFIAIFYSPLITLFLSTSQKETEFAPRIDFYGLMYLYSAMFAFTLKTSNLLIKNLSTTLAVFCILTSSNLLFEAQKVWKLGYETELKIYKRIINTYEQFEDFNTNKKYTIVNSGYLKMRPKFYHTPFTKKSDDLLDISFVPGFNPATVLQYQTTPSYINDNIYIYNFKPDTKALNSI
ncbi:MAG: glucosyltransferase domain-containing protein, partial [Alphaproteobacteria bacterium]|nr:glucosyltransferase domain-containing protein [Alphaproteobacteria bacterium]